LLIYHWHYIHSQSFDSLHLYPPLQSEISYVFKLEVPDKLERKILKSLGEKFDLYAFEFSMNDRPLEVKSCNTRGNNTLNFRRKSFSLSLKNAIKFDGKNLKKIAINNLAMDKNHWRNRISFLLMDYLEIFPLVNGHTELQINNRTQGVYLLVQKSDDYTRQLKSPLLLRRQYKGRYEVEEMNDDAKDLLKQFKAVNKFTRKFSGKTLYDSLNRIINLDQYFKWLAFNYLVMNGDYTDEVFFYFHPKDHRFHIIPWDYDDVFASQPHEGWYDRNLKLSDRLLFSGEAPFDAVIDKDDYLYKHYLVNFKSVLYLLNPKYIKSRFEQVYRELHPFYSQEAIISQSKYDQSGSTNLEKLEKDLQYHYQFILKRRSALLKIIEHDLTILSHL